MAVTEIKRFADARELGAVAQPFLMHNEVEHALILGLIDRMGRTPDYYDSRPYFAVALRDGEVAAVTVMTPPFPLVLSLCDDDDALQQLAEDVHAFLPQTAGVNSPAPVAGRFAEAWRSLTGDSVRLALAERVYRLSTLKLPSGVSGRARPASEDDVDLITDWQIAFAREAVPWEENTREATRRAVTRGLQREPGIGSLILWEDTGRPVCFAGYGNPTPNSMRIGPVYTPPEHRRRGYASACTAAACEAVFAQGKRFVTLFADLANPTSNHIYQEIGFEPVCDAEMFRFGGR